MDPANTTVKMVSPISAVRARCADLSSQLGPQLDGPSSASSANFESALQELEGIPESDASVELVDCLLAIAQYFYLTNIAARGLNAAARALDYSRAPGDKHLIRRALSVKGVMLSETGNMPGAIEAYAEAIKVARTLNDPSIEAPVWVNLGAALMTSAQYSDAMECFVRAETLARSADPQHAAANAVTESLALANISNCALHLSDVRRGIRAARRAIELNPDPSTAHDCFIRVMAESNYSRLLLDIGELTHAAEHCESARTYANKFPTPRSEYTASVTSGLVDVHSNRADIGLTRLKKALEHARRNVRTEVRDALQACVAGHESAGQPDLALVYLHELLAHNRNVKGGQLLTALAGIAGDLGLDHGDTTIEHINTAKALELQQTVDRCVADLVASAITGAEQAGHDRLRVFRVSRLAETLATSMGWECARARSLGFAARLADIGMLVIPTGILSKARGLSEAERKIVAEHTLFGAELLSKAGLAILKPCVPIARFHHERWDGTGLWGLKGEGIPLEARIYALCDCFDALNHERPWRKALSLPAALMHIEDEAGAGFDPALAEAFVSMVRTIYWEHKDFEAFLAQDAFENSYVLARDEIDRLIGRSA